MRLWFGLAGVVLALAIVVGLEGAVLAHRHPARLTAARPPVTASPVLLSADGGDPAPQRTIPRPTPDASPTSPAVAAPAAPPAPVNGPPAPSIVVNSTQQALINRDRSSSGLGALSWSSCLYQVAVSNAQRIAAQGSLSHTTGPQRDLACGLGQQGGENIGYWTGGINDPQLNTMFMNSPEHRANIMGPYHYVATAWVVAGNGTAYIAVEFG